MGNNIGGRKKAKVMKINGEILKLKTPIRAWDVIKDYPGHVLLESSLVKQFGIRAKPLEPEEELKAKKVYFLVELPKFHEEKSTRRVRSGVNMSAKDRLECLMLSRRSVSDLSIMRPISPDVAGPSSGSVRVKMRLPRAQVAKLVKESKDGADVAEKIVDLYLQGEVGGPTPEGDETLVHRRGLQGNPGLGSIGENYEAHEVSLL